MIMDKKTTPISGSQQSTSRLLNFYTRLHWALPLGACQHNTALASVPKNDTIRYNNKVTLVDLYPPLKWPSYSGTYFDPVILALFQKVKKVVFVNNKKPN